MPRELRARSSRPNYAALTGFGADEDEAGPSNYLIAESDGSGSEFEADLNAAADEDEADDMALDDAEPEPELESASTAPIQRKRAAPTRESSTTLTWADITTGGGGGAPKRKSKTPATARRAISLADARPPGPSPNHRHRAQGIYRKTGKTERLTRAPGLFAEAPTVPTNAWGENTTVADRVNKGWGYNVGPGPLWDLAEDRAWFKEARGLERTTERGTRPRVHERVALEGWRVIDLMDAGIYLPMDDQVVTGGDGIVQPPRVACSFGPFEKQTRLEMKMFDTVKLSQFFPESKSHVFNAGAPVWGLDWCPVHPDDRVHHRHRQYLAVAPFPSCRHSPKVGARVRRPSPACIQIWSLHSSAEAEEEDAMDIDAGQRSAATQDDVGKMRCEMVLCIDSGPAFELKWCPLPSNDPVSSAVDGPRKLGIIAGTFEDGSLTFFAVPDPATLEKPSGHAEDGPLYVKLSPPLLRIEMEETCCWSFDWANSEVVAIGCTNGSIAVYNVANALHGDRTAHNQPLLPTHYFTVHQSAIRSLAWVRAPVYSASGDETADDPTVIVSGGYDGVECVTDIRDMSGNVMNRTRDVVTTMCFSTYSGSAVTIDHENIIKAYSVSPTMLGRGHTILEPSGPIWSIAASEYHPQLAVGVTDGSCMTTNTMRSTRRGSIIPFLEHKIYQLDYSRALREYRMLEHFVPKVIQNRPTATRQNKSIPVGTGAWPVEVGVQRVVWNDGNGLGRTPLLASATGSGLCRVDWLLGRWGKEILPYGGVEGMRGETEATFEEDEGDSD
ncbi:hypothetical protein C8Q80DRAFT_1171827 [Daedaleopsis nitida]|nr:hypothetical protein C8Q80DRAFT_1171827 [Daedaleopsis nitida]